MTAPIYSPPAPLPPLVGELTTFDPPHPEERNAVRLARWLMKCRSPQTFRKFQKFTRPGVTNETP